jgi:protocatechuate 3,4-dioxygenase beta subunit
MIAIVLSLLLANQAAPQPAAPATIRGRVVRTDGRPLPHASVRLMRAFGPVIDETTADDDGTFEFASIRPGDYRLAARKAGYVMLEFGQTRASAPGTVVTLKAGEVRERVDFALPRHGAISGRIVDENGDPVEGANVSVRQIRFVNGRRQLVAVEGVGMRRTNDIGRYRLFGLQPGIYAVAASVGQVGTDDLPGYATTFFPGTPNAAEAQLVRIGIGADALDVDFALTPVRTARITGTTLSSSGEPFQGGIRMRASKSSSSTGGGEVGGITRSDGTFEFPNVPPGEYILEGFKNNELGWQVVRLNGADVAGVIVQTMPGSDIAGRITFEGAGEPSRRRLELAAVPADSDFAGRGNASADILDNLTFRIGAVLGPRRIRLTRTPAGWMLKSIRLNGVDVTDAVMSFGRPNQSLKDVEVVLTDLVTHVSGRVTDPRGAAITDCLVTVFPIDEDRRYDGSRFFASRQPASDGTFDIQGLPEGTYFVAAVDRLPAEPGLGDDAWQDPELLDRAARSAARISLQEGQTVSVMLRSPSAR